LPWSGESSSSAPAPLEPAARSARLGLGDAAAGAAPLTAAPAPPAKRVVGGPMTLTSNLRPETSTV